MEIRLLKEPELLPALHLVWEVFAAEIAPTCTPQGVESFQKFIKYDYISQVWHRGDLLFFGAYDKERLCGTLALRPDGHIALFFVEQKSQGQGIGRMLFQSAYNYCAGELKADRMTVNAAPGAVERYKRLGMRAVAGEQEQDGIRSVPMEMYVNLAMVAPVKKKAKAPWIALGVFGAVLLLVLLGVVAGTVTHRILINQRADHAPYDGRDDSDEPEDGFWDEYGDSLPEEFWDEYGGSIPDGLWDGSEGADEQSGEALSGVAAIPERIDDNLPYELEDDAYIFSDNEKQSMMIEFSVSYPKISGLKDSKTEKQVNKILRDRAMETVERIYENPDPAIKERVLGEDYPMLANYVEYKVCYATEDLISVAYDDYAFEGGQNYYTQHLRTCTVSLKDGRVYEVKDIVRLDDAFMDEWLAVMRAETDDASFLSEAGKDVLKKALEGDSQDGVYVVNFFLDADGIEIGFDLNYEEEASGSSRYIWVTAPFSFEEIKEYASDSDFWGYVR